MSKKVKADKDATLEAPIQITRLAKIIRWIDATFGYAISGTSISYEDAQDLRGTIRQTVGFVLKENSDVTVIAMNYNEDHNEYSKIMVIPSSLIIKERD